MRREQRARARCITLSESPIVLCGVAKQQRWCRKGMLIQMLTPHYRHLPARERQVSHHTLKVAVRCTNFVAELNSELGWPRDGLFLVDNSRNSGHRGGWRPAFDDRRQLPTIHLTRLNYFRLERRKCRNVKFNFYQHFCQPRSTRTCSSRTLVSPPAKSSKVIPSHFVGFRIRIRLYGQTAIRSGPSPCTSF